MNDSSNACPKCGATVPSDAPQGLCPKCVLGAAAAPEAGPTATAQIPSLERLAVAFPQLQILELIGRGGMGFVFKARQPHLDRFVALKLLPDSLAQDPHFAERFNREGRTLARLNHPNIVSIFDFGQAGGFYFLLMEYVDGVNLRQAMQAGRFSTSEALTIVPKICEALQYAHEEGVLHRDIKPENILLDAKGRVKIADFGIAKIVGEEKPDVSLTATGAALGTPHYMAPEQFEKPGTVDHRADIYSLGVVFYEMLTGELPIGRFALPSQKTPVDSRFDDVVLRTLEREREKRFQSAGEMKTNVEHLTGAAPARPLPPPPISNSGPARETIAIKPEDVLPATSKWSIKAICGAALAGTAFIAPIAVIAFILIARGAPARFTGTEIALALLVAALTGLPGTLLGWIALNDIHAQAGALRGLSLAVFAALALPLTLLVGITSILPFFILYQAAGPVSPSVVTRLLAFVLPAGTITFAIWAAFATARWGANRSFSKRSGVLKWVFSALMLVGLGLVLMPIAYLSKSSTRQAQAPVEVRGTAVATPWIGFTFTAVELRNVQGARWLAIDYLDDVHGDCDKSFPWETTIPGFKAETRTSEYLNEDDKSAPAVRHQRVEYRIPSSIPTEQLQELREDVERRLKHKRFRMELNDSQVPLLLFELPGVEGGSLKAWLKVIPNPVNSTQKQALGVVRLVGSVAKDNIMAINMETLPSRPLHEIVLRYSGPELPETVLKGPRTINGPYLIPSMEEELQTPVREPIASGDTIGSTEVGTASAMKVDGPGSYSFSFIFADNESAQQASEEVRKRLAQPVSLNANGKWPLFHLNDRMAWLELRPYYPSPDKFVFARRSGRSPAPAATNYIECAVASIPAGSQLQLQGRLMQSSVNSSEKLFSLMLTNMSTGPASYWFTWYSLPKPETMDTFGKEDWQFLVHDVYGKELFRVSAPESLKEGWSRRWVGETKRTAKAGEPIMQALFEKNVSTGKRTVEYVLLEMTMQRQAQKP